MTRADPSWKSKTMDPGIPETERPRVLERFYRIAGSAPGGCGLGLAIVDEIAKQHDARLSIESGAEGRGTRIRVTFNLLHYWEQRLGPSEVGHAVADPTSASRKPDGCHRRDFATLLS